MLYVSILCSTGGRQLTERETVTPQVVANWFANKRKEVKKLAKEGERNSTHSLSVCKLL